MREMSLATSRGLSNSHIYKKSPVWDFSENFLTPSVYMLHARFFGPGPAWTSRVTRHSQGWSPHQRRRFSMWCAMQLVAEASYDKPGTDVYLLAAIRACREVDSK
jgi:hypothetical protein